MACKDCFNNCGDPGIISDKCVQYTGPDVPLLGICTGDTLFMVEAQFAYYLVSLLDGTGITPADVTLENCAVLKTALGIKSPTLNNLLQLLIDNNCTLNEAVTAIQVEIAAQGAVVWDTGCLTGLPTTPTADDILQAVIWLLCNLNTTVATFPTTYVQNSDLVSLVTPIINSIIQASQASGVPQQGAKMVPYVAYEYYGTLSNFDAGGVGISSLGYQKVYICNGSNGTPDKRGRVAVGAVKNVPGGALDAAVDPGVDPNNPNWNLNDKAGENFHRLTINEIPSHTHQVNDPGHTHNYNFPIQDKFNGDNANAAKQENPETRQTASQKTGITLGATGGGQGHITYQPSIAANYIMYIP